MARLPIDGLTKSCCNEGPFRMMLRVEQYRARVDVFEAVGFGLKWLKWCGGLLFVELWLMASFVGFWR